MVAAGPRLATALVVWQAQYTEPPGGAGRRWPAAGCRVAGAVHRASWRSCCARGRRWPAACCRVAGAVHRASCCCIVVAVVAFLCLCPAVAVVAFLCLCPAVAVVAFQK